MSTAPNSASFLVAPRTETPPSSRRPRAIAAAHRVLDPRRLTYRLLRPRDAGPGEQELLGEAYRCWSVVWQETFEELEGRRDVPSDDFTRQDEVGAIFHEDECVALTFYRWLDLSKPVDRDDSYFSIWSGEARAAACAHGTRVCVGSNFTIGARWRRAVGCSLKDVLMGVVVERFLRSDADVLVGTMRADRGMTKLTDRLGFRRLQGGVIHHGVEVDLVAFYRNGCERRRAKPADEALISSFIPRGTIQ